jgi:ATP-dependent Clp protease protease subunit
MISDIEHSQIPVSTIVVGKAMSCGAVLLSCGTQGMRYIDKHATVMIHEVSATNVSGKTTDVISDAQETVRCNDYIFSIMALKCGRPKNYFTEKMRKLNNADWFLSPNEVLKHNLADKIGVPMLTRVVSVNYQFS